MSDHIWNNAVFMAVARMGPMVQQALFFAGAAHAAVGHKRKFTGENYIHHPIEVCNILIAHGFTNYSVLAAALLHDVIEDTQVTKEVLAEFFPPSVVIMVLELTDLPKEAGKRDARKAADRLRLKSASWGSQSIKCADLISNLKSIKEHDPVFYPQFLNEARLLVAGLTAADPDLRKIVEDLLKD